MIALFLTVVCFLDAAVHERVQLSHFAYLALVFAFLLVEFIQGELRYGQDPFGFFSAAYYFVFALLLPVFSLLVKQFGKRGLLIEVEKVVLVTSAFMLLCSALRAFLEVDITGITRMRSGLIRINAPFIVQLGPLISLYLCFVEKKKDWHAAGLALSVLALVFVYQSRLVILLVVLCLAVLVLSHYRSSSASFYLASVGMVIVVAALFAGPLNSIVNSFSTHGEYAGSTITRINETAYYLGLFKSNVVNGAGLIEYGSAHYSVISGSLGAYYIDDVGIIGALAAIGLWVIPLYVIPILALIKSVAINRSLQMLGWPILLYLIGTSFTTLIVFPYFDPAWPLVLVLLAGNREVAAGKDIEIRRCQMVNADRSRR
jgi:hypothetical protein